MPRSFSSLRRSASCPGSAFMSAVLPCSICPAVPMMAWVVGGAIQRCYTGMKRCGSELLHLLGVHRHVEVVAPCADLRAGDFDHAGYRQRDRFAVAQIEDVDPLVENYVAGAGC